jgi:hypothetical protein
MTMTVSATIRSDPSREKRIDVRLKQALESGTLPKDLLICGPAGTGKTYSILAFLHLLAADYRDLRILFCRRTRTALTESVLVTYEQEILPADGMEWIARGAGRGHRSHYLYPSGSEVVLGGLDDPTRIGSTAWDIVYANEAVELEEEQWETLGSRLDRPGRSSRFGFLIGDTNPGDPQHWLKRRCDEGVTAYWDTAHEANVALRDRGGWTEAGVRYLARLEKLRGTRHKRLKRGLWAAGEGAWFDTFGEAHEDDAAEFDPAYPVHLAVDPGVHTGAVWFQVRPLPAGDVVTVFGDYYSFNRAAYDSATEINGRLASLCGGRFDRGTMDPAGKAATGVGPTVVGEYHRAGLILKPWPTFPGAVRDGLTLIESFVAVDPPDLLVHPRCKDLLNAFANYRRAKRGGQYVDWPEDPQHPHEDLMDALRGGLMERYPNGRRPAVTRTLKSSRNPLDGYRG